MSGRNGSQFNDVSDDLSIGAFIIAYWWAIMLGLLVLTAIVLALLNPWFKNQETKTILQSNQYVQSTQAEMSVAVKGYNKAALELTELDQTKYPDRATALKRSMLNMHTQICDAAKKIDSQFVLEDAKQHMKENSCE